MPQAGFAAGAGSFLLKHKRLDTNICKVLLMIAGLLLLCVALEGIKIHSLSWEANFDADTQALSQASGIAIGESYDPELIKAAIDRIQDYLAGKGRYFVKIPFPELIPVADSLMELRFSLHEVMPSDQLALSFYGMRYFSEARLKEMLVLSDKTRISLNELERLFARILDIYHGRGFLFASVELDSLVMEDGLRAGIRINEGKVFAAERVYFEGNHYTRDEALLKLSGISALKTFSPRALEEAAQNIMRKPYIRQAIVEPIGENSLLIKVEEGRMTYLEGVIGYAGQKKELSGLLRIKFMNLWGSDRALNLNWRKDVKRSELELGYHESGFGNIPIAGDILLKRSTQDSLWIISSVQASVYGYHGYHRLGLELGSQDKLIDPSLLRSPTSRISSGSLGAFWSMDSAYPAANPVQGWQTRVAYSLLHSKEKKWRGSFELDGTQFLPLGKRLVGAYSLHIRNLEDAHAKEYELFQMGGYEKLRGYRQNEFASWRLGWLSWELRWRLDPGSRIHVFFDHGILARWMQEGSTQKIGYQTDIYGFGIGARIRTRIGTIGIDYALGKREKGISSFGEGMIHLGMDTSF